MAHASHEQTPVTGTDLPCSSVETYITVGGAVETRRCDLLGLEQAPGPSTTPRGTE